MYGMEVYQFNKTLLDRLQDTVSVLSWNGDVIAARHVRREWTAYIEMQIEPAGWQALWRVPRAMCEKLNFRYPAVAFGMVDQVIFEDLKAVYSIIALQQKNDDLPASLVVNLLDLWPTQSQEYESLNVERTADCIDQLRFFYRDIWFPWDNENMDDRNWVDENLELRINFLCDLQNGRISKPLSGRIKMLLEETRYIKDRREQLEEEMHCDEEEDTDDIDNGKTEQMRLKTMMKMHLRLAVLHSEIDMLMNPSMRSVYEELKLTHVMHGNLQQCIERITYLVMSPSTIDNHLLLLNVAKKMISADSVVQVSQSLQDILNNYHNAADLYLTPGTHMIQYTESLNNNGSITGISPHKTKTEDSNDSTACFDKIVIRSQVEESVLMAFDGDYTLTNVTLDCKNVVNGLLVKGGKLTLKNCKLLGSTILKSHQAIWCSNTANLVMEDCCLENFDTGIMIKPGSSVSIKNVKFFKCETGLDIDKRNTTIRMEGSMFHNSTHCGVLINSLNLGDEEEDAFITVENPTKLSKYNDASLNFQVTGKCIFKNCGANILILNERKLLVSQPFMDIIIDSNEIDSAKTDGDVTLIPATVAEESTE